MTGASTALQVEYLAALADAACWLGKTDETLAVSEEVYRSYLDSGQKPQAARLAMDIGFLSYYAGTQRSAPDGKAAPGDWFAMRRSPLEQG